MHSIDEAASLQHVLLNVEGAKQKVSHFASLLDIDNHSWTPWYYIYRS